MPIGAYPPCGLATTRRPFAGGLGHSRPPPCRWLGHGQSPLQEAWPEIVYPYIPYPNEEDEGGQASSSLTVSTRWISAVKFLQSDLTTLAQRERGEYEVVAKAAAYQP
ncbi:hypothetical protein B296_00055140 [Ensete ventricosum]|uniref:Uncharacterized protein n=1 Tax=Ensete ventricosum TaxID=4639 RepID=A0A426XFC8_ENSVE|nr:hypothetical protein B296_00055140 [Ensete ventricosum]